MAKDVFLVWFSHSSGLEFKISVMSGFEISVQ
jgi:hypothetical protein